MAKKKNKQAVPDDVEGEATTPNGSASQTPSKGSPKQKKAASTASDGVPALIICRNKHWRYISSYHGPWLQMPIEILETIANINYNAPRPRPIDPAVFFDLLKIRRLVDEATHLAVRAATGTASPTLSNVHGGLNGHMSSLGFGVGGGHGTKLSKERIFRMREQASQKLSRAFRLDEIACSVATMQGASTLEEIGSLVLQRNRDDPDAKYVHFFHEKIPSRQLAECTSLRPLEEIIAAWPTEGEPLRTMATVKIFKEDYEGAAHDLTRALQLFRHHPPAHQPPSPSLELQLATGSRRSPDVILTEEQQPSSLETQLLFQRASVYLTIACQHVVDGLPGHPANGARANGADRDTGSGEGAAPDEAPGPTAAEKEAAHRRLEKRKLVKTFAKKALRDYMAYLSKFEYTPDLPLKLARELTDKVNLAAQGSRNPRVPDSGATPTYNIYALSDLFAAMPPADIPPYPSQEVAHYTGAVQSSNYESITYHPLLTDALHSLLLCHCLVQTSTKELLRHAYMVARLARLADGYPIFQASRSPARADWIEVLRRGENWIQMSASWEQLCAPAPIPHVDGWMPHQGRAHPSSSKGAALAAAAAAITRDVNTLPDVGESEEHRKERIRQRAIMESLDDDRVVDEASLHAAVTARQKRAEEDYEYLQSLKQGSGGKAEPGAQGQPSPSMRRWSVDDGREYPILTERAAAIARWILEAPPVSLGTAKRKKKPGPKKDKANGGADAATAGL